MEGSESVIEVCDRCLKSKIWDLVSAKRKHTAEFISKLTFDECDPMNGFCPHFEIDPDEADDILPGTENDPEKSLDQIMNKLSISKPDDFDKIPKKHN